jgi:N-acetylglucosaminyldiphosphoundecaprenol N-acetyl-beta-D-mannosaminyltransferase
MEAAAPSRVNIAGATIDSFSFREAVERIIERARDGGPPAYVVTPNAHHVSLLRDSAHFRTVYQGAWLALADGVPLVWASRLLGTPLPERVSGSDLFPAICKAVAGTGLRIYLLGGRPGAAEESIRVLQERYPGLLIAGFDCPPMGFDRDPVLSRAAVDAVRAAHPDILFVALGAPKQENWMYENVERVGVPVAIGVGASFDIVAGMFRRAPKWVRKAGLEWAFRTFEEPGRLWKRYAVTNPRFVWLVARQYTRLRRGTPAADGGSGGPPQ